MALEKSDILEEAVKVAGAVKKIFNKVKNVHGGIKSVFKIAPAVVDEVEKVARAWADVTGADKKSMATESILLLIPPRWYFPEFVMRPLISWAIEAALKEIKKRSIK